MHVSERAAPGLPSQPPKADTDGRSAVAQGVHALVQPRDHSDDNSSKEVNLSGGRIMVSLPLLRERDQKLDSGTYTVGEVQSTLTCEDLLKSPSTSGLKFGKMVTVELGFAIMKDASLPWTGKAGPGSAFTHGNGNREKSSATHEARILSSREEV